MALSENQFYKLLNYLDYTKECIDIRGNDDFKKHFQKEHKEILRLINKIRKDSEDMSKQTGKKLHTRWFYTQWGEGLSYPTPDIGEKVDEFIQSEGVEPEDLIQIEYKNTETVNKDGMSFSTYTAFMVYKK